MCGCDPLGGNEPVAQTNFHAHDVAFDPNFLNIQILAKINWNEKAEAAGLKAVQLGANIGAALDPENFFSVTFEGKHIFYEKRAALEIAKKILIGPGIPVKDDDKISALCEMIIYQGKKHTPYTGGLQTLNDAQESAILAALDAQVHREQFESFLEVSNPASMQGVDAVKLAAFRKKLAEDQKTEAATKLERDHPERRLAVLVEYHKDLAAYLKFIESFNVPEIKTLRNIQLFLGNEIKAINAFLVTPKAAQFQELDILDGRLTEIVKTIEGDFASHGNPGISLFKAYQELGKRAQLIQALRKFEKSEENLRLVNLKGDEIEKKLNELLMKLPTYLSETQLTLLNQVKEGKIQIYNIYLGLFSIRRSGTEIADELRPLLSTLLARSVLMNSKAASTDASAMVKQISTHGDNTLWKYISKEGKDKDFQQLLSAWYHKING